MKLTIYLLRGLVTKLDEAVLDRYIKSEEYVEIKPTTKLPFPCRAWLQCNKAKAPRWLAWLSEAFDLSERDLINQTNSFVLVLKVKGRLFAVTFGYGFNAIDRTLVEPDFGLKVTLNTVDPQALDTLDTRTLDRVTKQTRIHLNVGRPVEEFGIQPDLDWLRSVRGTARGGQIKGKVQGAESVRVNWQGDLKSLADCCEVLLDLYRSKKYKTTFGFVDHLRPLPKHDPLWQILENKVLDLIKERDNEWLAVAHPEVPSPDVECFKIWCGHTKREDIDDLDLNAVFSFIDEYQKKEGEEPDLHNTWVIALDGDGQARSHKTSLWRYLVAHVEHKGHVYVLSLGQWFRTDKDYLDRLRETVAAIEDVSEEFDIPPWPKGLKERDFNRQLAKERQWLLLDQRMFTFGRPGEKIECADLLTRNQDFVHVKSMTSSATLSHLFAQGTVSARLFRTIAEYRKVVKQAFRNMYGTDFDDHSPLRVVYAIGTEKERPLAKSLFFFSLVNLVQHKEMLDAMGVRVALCRIRREDADQ